MSRARSFVLLLAFALGCGAAQTGGGTTVASRTEEIARVRAISIDTCSTCLGSSLAMSVPASSSGNVKSSTAAL